MDEPRTDLIIPAHNERESIVAVLRALPWDVLRRVVVVDNASTDGTAVLARGGGAQVVREPRRGYGAACLRGLDALACDPPDAVAFLDADLSDDPAMLPVLIQPILVGRADLVIGSRVGGAERGALTLPQRVGNALACFLIARTAGGRYSDLGPMRAIRWASLASLDMQDRTWGWTVEMQFKAAIRGLRVLEVPVPYRRRHAGRSKISGSVIGSVKAGGKIIATIAGLWWRSREREKGPPI